MSACVIVSRNICFCLSRHKHWKRSSWISSPRRQLCFHNCLCMCWQGVKVLAFATNRLRLLYQVSDNILEMIPTVAAEEYFSFFVSRHTKHTQGKVSLWHLKVSCRKTRVATWVGAGERSLGFTSKNCLRIFSKVVAEYWTHLDNVDEATTVRTHLVGFQRETSPWGRLVFLGSYYLTRRRNCFCNVVRHFEEQTQPVSCQNKLF